MACRVARSRPACFNAGVKRRGTAPERGNRPQGKPDDVPDCGRRGLRPAPGRAAPHQPVALSQRLLARPGDDPRHDRPGVAILSDPFADLLASRLAAGKGQARIEPAGHAQAGARSVQGRFRHLQPAVRRADGVFRGHAGCVLPGAERLAREGMARQGPAPARLDRDPDPERGKIGRRDRALRPRPPLRAGTDAGDGGYALGQARLLADLCGGRAARLADRHSRRLPPITTRRRRSAGAPITSRIMSPRRRRSRPSSPA